MAFTHMATEETLLRIADVLGECAHAGDGRITPLDGTALAIAPVVEVVGIPAYVSDVGDYAEYGITEPGWYAFARIRAKFGALVMERTTIEGAAGHIATIGADHIDLAVRFDVASQSCPIVLNWGAYKETIVFRATDLAVRNLDYRTTFYIYDLEPYCTWTYALTTDATFVAGKQYYALGEDGEYHLAEVTAGDAVPADTYYKHAKLTIGGMVRNVTYKLDTVVDCPIEVVLPAVPSDGYGAWYELQMRYDAQYSMTLTPPTSDVKAATDTTPAQTKGINIIDLHYADVAGSKVWRLINTHYTYAE